MDFDQTFVIKLSLKVGKSTKNSSLLANLVFSNNIAGSVSAPVLTEVCVVVVIVDTILEAEGVRLLMVVIMVAAAAVNHRGGVDHRA